MEKLFDTHAHLDAPEFSADLDEVLRRASEAGVERIISIGSGYGPSGAEKAVLIAKDRPNIRATVGIHPHEADLGLKPENGEVSTRYIDIWSEAADHEIARLRSLAAGEPVVGIGECGLDFFYNRSHPLIQKLMFEKMVELANETGKPCVVHDREAHTETLEILRRKLKPGGKVLFHCFSGDTAMASELIEMGATISVPGTVTFKAAEMTREVVRRLPIERIVLETDAPYLAPVPFRGKRNEPAYMLETAKKVAEIKGLSLDDVARITTRNAIEFFSLENRESSTGVIAYAIRDSLYLNITNRCTLACTFCAKRKDFVVKGHELRLESEPGAGAIIAAAAPLVKNYRELVFCGFGEPMIRPDAVKEVAVWAKGLGVRVRVNTDGLGNLVSGRDLAAELDGLVDEYSVSLNAPDAATYARICPSRYGERAFEAVKSFIAEARKHARVVATAVELPGLDVAKVKELAEGKLGVAFRLRPYDEVG